MAERLKDMFFTSDSVSAFAAAIQTAYPEFDKEKFMELVFDKASESKELMAKMRHATQCLHQTLPESFAKTVEILKQAAPHVKGFEAISLPDYIALYGMEDWDLSLPAFGHITQYVTAELAIRPFLDKDPQKVLPHMLTWAQHENHHIRRLASEGCRPRLPWAIALPKFKKDPTPLLPILELLKNDPSETVRRSVANNLNDISKDNPDITLAVCERWRGQSPETDKIIKHACRGMLKAGDKRALSLFGYSDPKDMVVSNLKLGKKTLHIGEALEYSFTLELEKKSKVRLEYAIHFVKAKGQLSKKVFKITENDYKAGRHSYKRKHSLADMSTRKHYPGTHRISLIINGEKKIEDTFELLPS